MSKKQLIASWVIGILLSIISFHIGWVATEIIPIETFDGLNNLVLFCLVIPALAIGSLIYFTG